MNFYQYVSARIPGFENLLSTDDIEHLKDLYNTFDMWFKTEKRILDNGMKSTTIDYGNDLEKTGMYRVMAKQALDESIIQMKARLQGQNKENAPTLK